MTEPGSDPVDAIRRQKSELRTKVRAVLGAISPERCREQAGKLCALLEQQPAWQEAQAILFFSSLPAEPTLEPLLMDALATGKTVALPKYDRDKGHYGAAVIKDLAELETGHFRILEPQSHCAPLPLNRLDFMLVPGVAFDWNGRRLGRGRGYYDRLLAEFHGWTCGVAFDEQIVEAVPGEPHDMRLTCLVTPTRWQIFNKPRSVLK